MVDIELLQTTVVGELEKYIGCEVWQSNQNYKSPKYPYVTYTITTVASENNGTYGEWEDGIARKGVNTVWSITAHAEDSAQSVTIANKAREWLEYVGSTYLNDNGVIVQAVTSITNRDNVLTSGYEYCNGFDCFFWCYDTIDISSIETIETTIIDGAEVTEESYADIIAELNRKLNEANADFENIRYAIQSKGIAITDETPTSEYANLIGQITGGVTDAELSETSTNPVQNKVITEALNNIDHSKLTNRDADDQHPIKAITGLATKLDSKVEEIPAMSNLDIERIISSFT